MYYQYIQWNITYPFYDMTPMYPNGHHETVQQYTTNKPMIIISLCLVTQIITIYSVIDVNILSVVHHTSHLSAYDIHQWYCENHLSVEQYSNISWCHYLIIYERNIRWRQNKQWTISQTEINTYTPEHKVIKVWSRFYRLSVMW